MAAQNKLREEMANRFLEALERDKLPWQACWQQARPQNAVTEKLYRGINALYLSYAADELGYKDPRWCTYNQAQEKGWQVRKGAKAARVEYWAYYDTEQKKLLSWQEVRDRLAKDPDYAEKLQLRSRVYCVFNAEQIDGIPALVQSERNTDIGALRQQRDTLLFNMGVGYQEYGDRAFYSPGFDTVTLPPEESFDDTYSYMATFLHECGHATGHHTRLDRDLSGGFGSPDYAREELRAEIASAFTAQVLGLQVTDEQLQHHMELHIAYVQSWIQVLQKSPEELFRAIKAAEEISDYLIEKGEFEMIHYREPIAEKAAIPAAVESTDDYADHGFGAKLVDIDVQNEDGSFGRVVEQYRIVTIGSDNYLRPIDDRVFSSNEEAVAAIARNPDYHTMSYDDIVHEAMNRRTAGKSEAHEQFLKEAADRGRYTDTNGAALPHPTSLLTPPRAILELAPQYPWANREQLDEIAAGLQENLTPKQVALYAKPEFSAIQMNSLRYAIQDNLPMAHLQLMANPAFNSVQMDVLRCCFQAGMTTAQMQDFARPEIPAQQMLEKYWAVKQSQELSLQQAPTADLEPTGNAVCEADYGPDM